MADEGTTTINAEIPTALHTKVRIEAAQRRRSVKECVREALEQWLTSSDDNKPKAKASA